MTKHKEVRLSSATAAVQHVKVEIDRMPFTLNRVCGNCGQHNKTLTTFLSLSFTLSVNICKLIKMTHLN